MRIRLNESALRPGPIIVLAAETDGEINNPSEDGNTGENQGNGEISGDKTAEEGQVSDGNSEEIDKEESPIAAETSAERTAETGRSNQESVVIVDTGLLNQYKNIVSQMRFNNFLFMILIVILLIPRFDMKRRIRAVMRGGKYQEHKKERNKKRDNSQSEDNEEEQSGGDENEDSDTNGSDPGMYVNNMWADSPADKPEARYDKTTTLTPDYVTEHGFSNLQRTNTEKCYLTVDNRTVMGNTALLRKSGKGKEYYILSSGNIVEPAPKLMNRQDNIAFFVNKGIDILFDLKQGNGSLFYLQNESPESKIILKELLEPAQVKPSGQEYTLSKKGTLLVEVK